MGRQKNTQLCQATTRAGERCKKYTKSDEIHCCRHRRGEKPPLPVKPIDDVSPTGSCSICLDGVAHDEDCGLMCGHPHHQSCILQLRGNAACPICRGTLDGCRLTKTQLSDLVVDIRNDKLDEMRATYKLNIERAIKQREYFQGRGNAYLVGFYERDIEFWAHQLTNLL